MMPVKDAEEKGLACVGGFGIGLPDLRALVRKISEKGFEAHVVWCPFKECHPIFDEFEPFYKTGQPLVFADPAYIYTEDIIKTENELRGCAQRRSSLTRAYALAMVELDKEEEELTERKNKNIAELKKLKKDGGKK